MGVGMGSVGLLSFALSCVRCPLSCMAVAGYIVC